MQDPPPSNSPSEQPPPDPPPPPAPPSGAPRAGGGPRWGEPGYRSPPDPDRQGRLAVAWIVGALGALALAVAALGGFAILFSMGQRQPAPVVGAPFPTAAPQPTTAPPATGQDPTAPTTGAGSEPPGNGSPSRSTNAYYSIKLPDDFEDVTDRYRGEHPAERNTVQVLAGRPGSPSTPDSSIVISRLPAGSGRGRSLDQLAADRVRALQREGASRPGAPRHSSIGPDPAVEVDMTVLSGGRPLRRTEVLCVHEGRVWEVAVTGPVGGSRSLAGAWLTVKTGWQWQ